MDEQFSTCTDSIVYKKGYYLRYGWQMNTHGACSSLRHPNFKLAYCWDIQILRFERIEDRKRSLQYTETYRSYGREGELGQDRSAKKIRMTDASKTRRDLISVKSRARSIRVSHVDLHHHHKQDLVWLSLLISWREIIALLKLL